MGEGFRFGVGLELEGVQGGDFLSGDPDFDWGVSSLLFREVVDLVIDLTVFGEGSREFLGCVAHLHGDLARMDLNLQLPIRDLIKSTISNRILILNLIKEYLLLTERNLRVLRSQKYRSLHHLSRMDTNQIVTIKTKFFLLSLDNQRIFIRALKSKGFLINLIILYLLELIFIELGSIRVDVDLAVFLKTDDLECTVRDVLHVEPFLFAFFEFYVVELAVFDFCDLGLAL